MKIIFYSASTDERTKEICKAIEKSSKNIGLELHHSRNSLENRLRQPLHGVVLMLFYLSGENDLLEMIEMQELITDIPLILIMRDTAGELMTKAHLLRPRFIFGTNDNLEDICLVFEKILARQKQL